MPISNEAVTIPLLVLGGTPMEEDTRTCLQALYDSCPGHPMLAIQIDKGGSMCSKPMITGPCTDPEQGCSALDADRTVPPVSKPLLREAIGRIYLDPLIDEAITSRKDEIWHHQDSFYSATCAFLPGALLLKLNFNYRVAWRYSLDAVISDENRNEIIPRNVMSIVAGRTDSAHARMETLHRLEEIRPAWEYFTKGFDLRDHQGRQRLRIGDIRLSERTSSP